MAQSVLLPLRSSPNEPTSVPLETRIRQIESLKGSIRTVTEKSLQEQIDKSATGESDAATESEESDEEGDSPDIKQKKLWMAREEMMKQLLRAQNETLTALDSVSLLLSRYPKQQAAAKASMSPALSSAVSGSTLDAAKVKNAPFSAPVEQRKECLYLGYKLDGLNKAIDKINSARTRLGDQAKHESAFWKQVADLSAEGLVVSRLPHDSRRIGVHFGFPEAASRFRNRGFALLRTDQDGELQLDQAITASTRYSIRVMTYRGGKMTGRSKLPPPLSSKMTISGTVADLRRNLFEEELFFEIGREARAIANQGVAIVDNAIDADISNGQKMRIELVDQEQRTIDAVLAEDGTADAMVLCLRSLLSKGHEQSLARRSQPPAPLIPKAASVTEYALLRPLLSHMRHQSLLSALQRYCDSFETTMRTAGLSFKTKLIYAMTIDCSANDRPHRELLLNSLLAPADSKLEITLPTGRTFEMKIRTHLAPPAFGTVFTASPIQYNAETITPPNMSNLDAVKSALGHVLTVDIVGFVGSALKMAGQLQQPWTSTGRSSGELRSNEASLYIKAITEDTSIGLRYVKRNARASSETDIGWVWRGDKMLRFSADTRETKEPLDLIEIMMQVSKISVDT